MKIINHQDINNLKYDIRKRILYSLYCTLIMPNVNYGIKVWGNIYHSYIDKIFKLQNGQCELSQKVTKKPLHFIISKF